MAHNHMRAAGAAKMDGPTLVFTTATQASAAGGVLQYAFVSCYGAKAIQFFVRTAAGVPTLTNSTIDIDPGGGISLVTGQSSGNYNTIFGISPGEIHIAPGDVTNTFANTNNRFMVDRIAPRVQLAASATGVSCWAVTQWD